jgi:DNA-binding NarL/FixJ family response regulator
MKKPSAILKTLSPFEREVYSCLKGGLSDKEISTALNMTTARASHFVRQLRRKFGYSNRKQFMLNVAS